MPRFSRNPPRYMWPDDRQRPLWSRDQRNIDEARQRLEEDYAAGAPRDLGGYLRWSAARLAREGHSSGTTYQSLHEVERVFGAFSSSMPASDVLKPAGVALLDGDRVFYLQKLQGSTIVDRAWAVIPKGIPVDPREQNVFAARLGKKLFSALIAKSKVHYSVPHLHDHRLYVLLPQSAHVVIPNAPK